jgi:hypothetical protein
MKLRLSPNFVIDSETSPWNVEGLRICLFGGPGSGKSWTSALIVEQWLTQGGTVVIFEPRSEYHTLKEKFDIVVFGGVYSKDMDFLPVTPKVYAKSLVEDGVSMIFYTDDIENEEKLIDFTSKFIRHVLKLQETHKRPILLIVEEAQEYAPLSTKGRQAPPWVYGRMIKAFKDCFLQGRKLNVSTIAASPRPQEINFTIRQLANLTFYGKFSRQDIGYIDRECFKPYRQKGEITQAAIFTAQDLIDLAPGKWLMVAGREAKYIEVTEPRKTPHGAETPKLTYTAPRKQQTQKSIESLAKSLKTAIDEEQKEGSELEKEKRKTHKLEEELANTTKKIENLETALTVAGKIKIEAPSTQTAKPKLSEKDIETFAKHIIIKVKDTIEKEATGFLSSHFKILTLEESVSIPEGAGFISANDEQVYIIWAPKMPSLCAKRIFKFLLDNKGAKYTRAQVGVNLGYKTSSGTFAGALAFLRQNNLIQYDGKYLWIE